MFWNIIPLFQWFRVNAKLRQSAIRACRRLHNRAWYLSGSAHETVNKNRTNLNHPSPLLLINLHLPWHLTNLVLSRETSGLQLLKILGHRWNNNRNSLAGPWSIGQVFAIIVLLNCSSWNHLSLESIRSSKIKKKTWIPGHMWLESQLQWFMSCLQWQSHLCFL